MTQPRLVAHIDLEPALGRIFQPTGFPDVGAAEFDRPNGDGTERCLLVESAQSMANHLEAAGWDAASQAPVRALDGLPWIRVVAADDGRFLTSSRLEAHRLASAFVKDATLDGRPMREVIKERLRLRDDTPLDHRAIAAAVFALDPLALVHGVFFAEKANVWPGQPRIARAFTALIEAAGVHPVISGGVKRDAVRHMVSEGGGSAEGYGFVPFHREEYTARSITLHVSLDRLQLRSYGLGDDATDLLEAVALWELRSVLDRGLRPRTACELLVKGGDDAAPPAQELEDRIGAGARACADRLGVRGPLDVVWSGKAKK